MCEILLLISIKLWDKICDRKPWFGPKVQGWWPLDGRVASAIHLIILGHFQKTFHSLSTGPYTNTYMQHTQTHTDTPHNTHTHTCTQTHTFLVTDIHLYIVHYCTHTHAHAYTTHTRHTHDTHTPHHRWTDIHTLYLTLFVPEVRGTIPQLIPTAPYVVVGIVHLVWWGWCAIGGSYHIEVGALPAADRGWEKPSQYIPYNWSP